jgi:nitrous oxide reductase accessory protein NosL
LKTYLDGKRDDTRPAEPFAGSAMKPLSRKRFHGAAARVFFFTLLMLAAFALPAAAEDVCMVAHPLHPPDPAFAGQCPNCGMLRSMWARTWTSFTHASVRQSVCSLHCLADVVLKSGLEPTEVMVAAYLEPNRTLPAVDAYFVLGSRVPGTMTRISKPAFPDRTSAETFAQACGGRLATFREALGVAERDLPAENAMIAAKRLQTGKIVEPAVSRDRCPVCEMFPARYPRHKCQILARNGRRFHFCSTQCLFKFLAHPERRAESETSPRLIWVTDFAKGGWIGGRTAYYVTGSNILGPMGHEAIAFDRRSEAAAFARRNGGRVLTFDAVSGDSMFRP